MSGTPIQAQTNDHVLRGKPLLLALATVGVVEETMRPTFMSVWLTSASASPRPSQTMVALDGAS